MGKGNIADVKDSYQEPTFQHYLGEKGKMRQ